jgi:hypothetical protein
MKQSPKPAADTKALGRLAPPGSAAGLKHHLPAPGLAGVELTAADPAALRAVLDAGEREQAASDLAAVLAGLAAATRQQAQIDLAEVNAGVERHKEAIAELTAGYDPEKIHAALVQAAKAGAGNRIIDKGAFGTTLTDAGVDLSALQTKLLRAQLVKELLPSRIVGWVQSQAEIIGLDWEEVLAALLRGGLGAAPSQPAPEQMQLTAPWPVRAATGSATTSEGGDLSAAVQLVEIGDWQDSATVGARIRVPAGCTHVRVDAAFHGYFYAGAGAFFGYAGADVHVGVGIWDGSTQLVFNEQQMCSAYAPAFWAADSAQSGDYTLSADLSRSASATDVYLTVALVARGNCGGGALDASALAHFEVHVSGMNVQMAF